jgi:palmitoyl-protein thioesterase
MIFLAELYKVGSHVEYISFTLTYNQHGMGDSCFNGGMQNIVAKVAAMRGTYATCIPIGDDQQQDTTNGYFLNWNASVAVFADKVRADLQLANGFHAIGFSQGSNVIRGYIAMYNEPTVHAFLSVNGVNAGIAAVPYCIPKPAASKSSTRRNSEVGLRSETAVTFSVCDLLMEQASRAAYTSYAQEHSFQANYWRDPRPEEAALYREFGQLAKFNNEAMTVNETLKTNWAKTQQFVWILATEDALVFPREGEQWGAPDPKDPFTSILSMEDTKWYQKDLFGLRSASEAGKNFFESFQGDHLRFSEEDFERWINTYLNQ